MLSPRRSEGLREELVDQMAADHRAKGLSLRPEIEAALRTVPRELFIPGVPLEQAYANTAVVTKRRGEETVSSVSAPYLVAEMLGQAADALGGLEGRNVLEVGSGGYNASLLSELVRPAGRHGNDRRHRSRCDRPGVGLPGRGGLQRCHCRVRRCRAAGGAGPPLGPDHRHRRGVGCRARVAGAVSQRQPPVVSRTVNMVP